MISKEEHASLDIQQTARKFLDRETIAGLLLILVTFLALIIGNSAWSEFYHHFLEDTFILQFSEYFSLELSIERWINDGLMAIFFLVAGLELKREVRVGELSTFQQAAMPLLAAVGGMVVPALIFISMNAGTENIRGWGIPMATDIAYALGLMGLLGKRIPAQLNIFLIALAIADDLGAIVVIAVFYSSGISWLYLGIGALVFVLLIIFNLSGVKRLYWYVPCGFVLWYCFLYSGIHPTVAGVLLAFVIPVKPELDSEKMKERTAKNVADLELLDIESRDPLEDKGQRKILRAIKRDAQKARPPLLKLENMLIDFNALFIIPVFALANAGVKLNVSPNEILTGSLEMGIILGLVIGKVLGITLFSYLGEKLRIVKLHNTLKWHHIIGAGMIAGIGFTMSLFITRLAFYDPLLIKTSKISILLASLISAIAGILILLFVRKEDE